MVLEQMATTTMDIELHNPASRLQEAELLVPVPDGAARSTRVIGTPLTAFLATTERMTAALSPAIPTVELAHGR